MNNIGSMYPFRTIFISIDRIQNEKPTRKANTYRTVFIGVGGIIEINYLYCLFVLLISDNDNHI